MNRCVLAMNRCVFVCLMYDSVALCVLFMNRCLMYE